MIILLLIKSPGLKKMLQLFFIDRKRGNTILAVMSKRKASVEEHVLKQVIKYEINKLFKENE